MFFDLNVPVVKPAGAQSASKKGKQTDGAPLFSQPQLLAIESRVELLVHLGYSVIAFSQTVHRKVDPKTHLNYLEDLLSSLQPRAGVVFLRRLNIVLDHESEKGFGLINANVSLFNGYDLIALIPTTNATFSLACLSHTLPSALTAHIITIPLTLPRLPYHLKHTLIRTALKNGAVFEVNYVGAVGGEQDAVVVDAGAAESGTSAKRNWWACTRELLRVTKGKGLILSGGVVSDADARPPRDVANLLTLAGLAQNAAHEAIANCPRSLVVRAQTRKTYRAIFSEPKVVLPEDSANPTLDPSLDQPSSSRLTTDTALPQKRPLDVPPKDVGEPTTIVGNQKKKRKRDQKQAKPSP